jgi:hypothetical protein
VPKVEHVFPIWDVLCSDIASGSRVDRLGFFVVFPAPAGQVSVVTLDPTLLDNRLEMTVKLAVRSTGRALLARNIILMFMVLISVKGRVNPRASAAARIR